MKRFVLVFALLIFFQSTAFAIGAAYSGTWYNPEQSGHGFSLEYSVLNDGTPIVVAYWYVYDAEGNPIFLIGVGEPQNDNSVTLNFEAPYGMKFGEFDPAKTVRADGGIGVFTFADSESGTFEYDPSQWMKDTYTISPIKTPVVKFLGVAHPNPEIVEVQIPAKFLNTTEKTADFPVCFNGNGELLPCASNVEPPAVDPYLGTWSGRMTYDRRSMGTCHDADVSFSIGKATSIILSIDSLVVILDSGGIENVGWIDNFDPEQGSASGSFSMFYSEIKTYTDFTLQFDAFGSAEGYWNYYNQACYGTWTFTKD